LVTVLCPQVLEKLLLDLKAQVRLTPDLVSFISKIVLGDLCREGKITEEMYNGGKDRMGPTWARKTVPKNLPFKFTTQVASCFFFL